MKTTIKGSDAFAYVDVELAPGEKVIAEADAMSSMSADLDMHAKFNGGFFIAILRKLLVGETLFINHFSNRSDSHVLSHKDYQRIHKQGETATFSCPGNL